HGWKWSDRRSGQLSQALSEPQGPRLEQPRRCLSFGSGRCGRLAVRAGNIARRERPRSVLYGRISSTWSTRNSFSPTNRLDLRPKSPQLRAEPPAAEGRLPRCHCRGAAVGLSTTTSTARVTWRIVSFPATTSCPDGTRRAAVDRKVT